MPYPLLRELEVTLPFAVFSVVVVDVARDVSLPLLSLAVRVVVDTVVDDPSENETVSTTVSVVVEVPSALNTVFHLDHVRWTIVLLLSFRSLPENGNRQCRPAEEQRRLFFAKS